MEYKSEEFIAGQDAMRPEIQRLKKEIVALFKDVENAEKQLEEMRIKYNTLLEASLKNEIR
jgi:hypothetical protein